MRARHTWNFDRFPADTIPYFANTAFDTGPGGITFEGGLAAGENGLASFSRSGTVGGLDEARNGAAVGNFLKLGDPSAFSPGNPEGGIFSLKSAVFAAAFHETVTFNVVAYRDNALVYNQNYTVEDDQRTRIKFTIQDVDLVFIQVLTRGALLPFDQSVENISGYSLMMDEIRVVTSGPPEIFDGDSLWG